MSDQGLPEMPCRELVELVTDYLEDRLSPVDRARFEAWQKLEREAERAAMATNALARRAERKKWSAISKSVGVHMKMKYGAER